MNGPVAIKNKEIELECISQNNERVIKEIKIDDVKPFGLGWVSLNLDEDDRFDNGLEKTCVKVRHDFEGFFLVS